MSNENIVNPFECFLQARHASDELAELLGVISQKLGYLFIRDPALQFINKDAAYAAGVRVIETAEDGADVDISAEPIELEPFRPHASVPAILVVRKPQFEAAIVAMQRGAFSVLRLPLSLAKLEGEILRAMELSKSRMDHQLRWQAMDKQLQGLTEGEFQVLRFVMDGSLNKRIAVRLGISERTVEARRKRIFEKTKTHSVAELVREIVETVGADSVFQRGDGAQANPLGHHWKQSAFGIPTQVAENRATLSASPAPSRDELEGDRGK